MGKEDGRNNGATIKDLLERLADALWRRQRKLAPVAVGVKGRAK